MRAYAEKLLANNANKFSVRILPTVASALRSVNGLVPAVKAYATSVGRLTEESKTMLRRFIACGTIAGSIWTSLALGDVVARTPREVARVIERLPMTLEEQWGRITGVIRAAIESFGRIEDLHAAAARQIDAADYALSQLLHDLRAAMPLPADVAALRAVLAEAERTAPRRYRHPAALAA